MHTSVWAVARQGRKKVSRQASGEGAQQPQREAEKPGDRLRVSRSLPWAEPEPPAPMLGREEGCEVVMPPQPALLAAMGGSYVRMGKGSRQSQSAAMHIQKPSEDTDCTRLAYARGGKQGKRPQSCLYRERKLPWRLRPSR